MERLKRFLVDDSASAELTSGLLLTGAVIVVGGAALGLYYGAVQAFFTAGQGFVNDGTTAVGGATGPWTPGAAP